MTCEYCDDGGGVSAYPYYSVSPHTHDLKNGIIGSTRLLPKDQWPKNFKADPEGEECGTYLYCPYCGDGV